MRFRLPLVGEVRIGKDPEPAPSVASVEVESEEKVFDVLGGMLQFNRGALSDEKTVSKKILEANKEWVYRNNDVIAQEVSQIEFQLYSVGLKEGGITFDEIDEHPVLDLLDRFNSSTTRMDGLYITQSHKKLTGDAFWLLDKNGKLPQNIFVLPPDKIELRLADPTDATADLVTGYTYKDVIDGKDIKVEYAKDEVIHFKKPNPKNPFRGYGAVEAISETIDTDNLANYVQRRLFDGGIISNSVLTTPNKITQDQLKRIRAELRAMYSGARNAYNMMIFGNGLEPKGFGFTNRDMQFLDLLEWYRDKIMVAFGNTKATLGIIDDVNRASYEGAYASWLRGTIKPDMDSIVATLNEFLVPLYGKNLVLGYKNPVPEDVTDDVEQAVELKQAGIIQINEARDMVGLDAIEGGDAFAPNSGAPAGDEPDENNRRPNETPVDEDEEQQKRMVRRAKKNKSIPAGLAHMDIKTLLRSRKMFTQQRVNRELKEAAKPVIRKLLQSKQASEEPRLHAQFTNEQIESYYEKQINIVDVHEKRFEEAVLKLITKVKDQALGNLETEINSVKALKRFIVKKELFNHEEFKLEAQLDLTPLLMQELVLAGQEAYRLIGVEDTYVPYKVTDTVREYVDKFATSMLETDKQQLTNIITQGIEQGNSVPEIRDAIQEKFGQYSKMQAERITRTEVLRVSNLAAEDAFEQSGVVEAKQWLVAPNACPICQPLANKVVGLGKNFYDSKGDYENGNPPKHPQCRCVLIPIVVGAKAYQPNVIKERDLLAEKIKDLESQFDKRTKAFKELQEQRADDTAYIKALEKHLGVGDE